MDLLIKAALSGILIAIISEVAKRYPGVGGLIASLHCSARQSPGLAARFMVIGWG